MSACNTPVAPGGRPDADVVEEAPPARGDDGEEGEDGASTAAAAAETADASPPAAADEDAADAADARAAAARRRSRFCSCSQSSIIARSVKFGTTCDRFRRCFVLGSVC